MSNTATPVGAPRGQWFGNPTEYELSRPHYDPNSRNYFERVIVTSVEIPHHLDPDSVDQETLIFGEVSTLAGTADALIGSVSGFDHEAALRSIGYRLAPTGDLVQLVSEIHASEGGDFDGPLWEDEIQTTETIRSAFERFQIATAGPEAGAVDEAVADLVVAAIRAALVYGTPIAQLIRDKATA
ncbi:hypothetical protein ACH47B_13125 [Rhodococcus sp. NPDC019627]|uniref:hypothetical protein n=1 Tax=unclassified Rhodococcus (in: high G+C Gram-positive bacteria) TaxID=192944 RepID=UPI0033D31A2B